MQILLHKQKLTKAQSEKLMSEGVVAIQTDDPESFKFIDVTVPQIQMDDMVWCLVDALHHQSDNRYQSRDALVKNLKTLADERRAKGREVK